MFLSNETSLNFLSQRQICSVCYLDRLGDNDTPTIIHERILQLRTREADVGEVIQHAPRGPRVNHRAQAQQRHATDERQHVGSGRFHGEDDDGAASGGVGPQHRDDEVRVQGIGVPGRLVQQQQHRILRQLHPQHQPSVLRPGQIVHRPVGDLRQRQVGERLPYPGLAAVQIGEPRGVRQGLANRETRQQMTSVGHVAAVASKQLRRE